MEKSTVRYTEKDIGQISEHSDERGTTYDDRIVMVYCQACGARFIGPIREAGGFLGGHEMFHTWEFKMEIENTMEA